MYLTEMERRLVTVFFLVIFSSHLHAQFTGLPMDRQRLLLQLSSGFYNVMHGAQVNMDSSLLVTSKALQLRRSAVILEGFEKDFDSSNARWIDQGDPDLAKKRLPTLKGIEHAKLMTLIGAYYSFQSGARQNETDSALFYLLVAKSESESLDLPRWADHALLLIGKSYFGKNDLEKGDAYFKLAIDDCQKRGYSDLQAKAGNYYGTYCPFNTNMTKGRISRLENATALYRQSGRTAGEIITLMYQCYLNFSNADPSKSTTAGTETLRLQDSIGFRFTHYTNFALALLSDVRGDVTGMLNYGLAAVRAAETTGDRFGLTYFYLRVANAYQRNDVQKDKADLWYKKSLDESMKTNSSFNNYIALEALSKNLFGQGKINEAIKLINSFVGKYPPRQSTDQQIMLTILARCYDALNNIPAAEKYYLQALQLESQTGKVDKTATGSVYYSVGDFYARQRKYDKAELLLNKFLSNPYHVVLGLPEVAEAEKDLSKIDSAKGNFHAALLHMSRYEEIHDKVFNATELKQLENLKVQYASAQQEQSIKLLESQRKVDQTELQKVGLQRNLTLGGISMLLIIAALAYIGYRNKRRSNLLLNAQQKEINEKNARLEKIVTEKDGLLSDKDLLLKEVHHRVKNNLHIVMNLLEAQSSYLNNNAALEAILESQNRVQAIALIHQQLYSTTNITKIDMFSYIPELLDSINESINTQTQGIVISHNIETILLDVSQAIPIGIILNEAVTNAIKYAFPDGRKGEIIVTMQQKDDRVYLQVSDNGVGFPPDHPIRDSKSLGMNLMNGLTNQLKGSIDIGEDDGVRVSLEFAVEAPDGI